MNGVMTAVRQLYRLRTMQGNERFLVLMVGLSKGRGPPCLCHHPLGPGRVQGWGIWMDFGSQPLEGKGGQGDPGKASLS